MLVDFVGTVSSIVDTGCFENSFAFVAADVMSKK